MNRHFVRVFLVTIAWLVTVPPSQLRAGTPVYELDLLHDAYEPNDWFSESHYLYEHNQWLTDLSIFPAGDLDVFMWSPYKKGNLTVYIYDKGNGPLYVSLWNKRGTVQLAYTITSGTGASAYLRYDYCDPKTSYHLLVLSANGGTNANYDLILYGGASDGQFNFDPQASDFNLAVTESIQQTVDLSNRNAFDPDGDPMRIEQHASPNGRMILDGGYPRFQYLPGTSIRAAHDFTYVLDDGRGGRGKGRVHVTVTPISDQLAFDGALGAGAHASGGRGGDIYRVTSLQDDVYAPQPGTLRHGLATKPAGVPRTIVFTVGGVIELQRAMIVPSDVTIAGETAPDPGITILSTPAMAWTQEEANAGGTSWDQPVVRIGRNINDPPAEDTHDVIVRYVRIRDRDRWYTTTPKPGPDMDALKIICANRVMIDHCSLSWGNDETLEIWDSDGVTVQWSIISETLAPHSMGTMINRDDWDPANPKWGHVTLHHNLWAHHDSRVPKIVNKIRADVVNNVMYNWGGDILLGSDRPTHVGTWVLQDKPPEENYGDTDCNIVRNYYIPGPDDPGSFPSDFAWPLILAISPSDTVPLHPEKTHRVYIEGNVHEFTGAQEPHIDVRSNVFRSDAPLDTGAALYPAGNTSDSWQAWLDIKQKVGAALPSGQDGVWRDYTDNRILFQAEAGKEGIISVAPYMEVYLW